MKVNELGKIVINLEKLLQDLSEMDGFFRGYFKREAHDYHTTIKDCKSIIEKEMEKQE